MYAQQSMEAVLQQFPEQLLWRPQVQGTDRVGWAERVLVCGMGGSHLAADLLAAQLLAREDKREIRTHHSYGIPPWAQRYDLVILSSFSGETEETIDAWHAARARDLPVAVIASGGTLLSLAQAAGVPFVALPRPQGMQPRLALGWSAHAIAALVGWEDIALELCECSAPLAKIDVAAAAQHFVEQLRGKLLAVYAPYPYGSLAHLWKIFFNETGKTLAWDAEIPEANHNDIEGFDAPLEVWPVSPEKVAAVFLSPEAPVHPRIALRMELTRALLEERGVVTVRVEPDTVGEAGVWGAALLGAWVAFFLARERRVDPMEVRLITVLKQQLKSQEGAV